MVIRLTFLFLQFVYIVICQWGPPPPPPPPPGFGGPGDFWPMSFEEKMNARNILDTETRSLTFAPPPLKRMLRNYCKQSRIGHPRCGEVFRPRHMGPMDQFHGPPPPPPPPPPPQRRPDYDEEEGWNGQNVNRNQGWESSVPQSQMMQNTNINPSPSSPLPNGFVPPTAPSIPDPPGFSDAVPRGPPSIAR
uniref:Uncharacterized protein n=1 Tax=Parastrongyloides trichosuri TaxID=131310 RepID=A0A0N4ZTA7_PARTI